MQESPAYLSLLEARKTILASGDACPPRSARHGGIVERDRAPAAMWRKSLLSSENRERRGRDELTHRRPQNRTFHRYQSGPLTKIKKHQKMKVAPNKLMKTNAKISDKTDHPNECMKTNELYKTADEFPINYRKQSQLHRFLTSRSHRFSALFPLSR